MRIEIPSEKLGYWKQCALNGIKKIEEHRAHRLEQHELKIKNRNWFRQLFGESEWDLDDRKWTQFYEFDNYEICENFLIMIETGAPSIHLNAEEVLALRRWETK